MKDVLDLWKVFDRWYNPIFTLLETQWVEQESQQEAFLAAGGQTMPLTLL